MTTRPRAALVVALAFTFLVGPHAEGKRKKKAEPQSVEDLQIVDCLLPGQVRQLGRRSSYVTARRPIRTSAIDCRIRGGEYVAEDRGSYAFALRSWLPLAESGDAEAQTYVGEIFEKGLAGRPDPGAAAEWYRRAAEAGHARAQINLAHLYERGLGVPLDPAEALLWYRRAAGLPEAVMLDAAELEALQERTAELEGETERLSAELEATEGRLDRSQRELETARRELDELRRELEAGSPEDPASVESAIEVLVTQVAEREAEIVEDRHELTSKNEALLALRSQLEEVRESEREATAALAGPSIEIQRPDVLTTRGAAIAAVPAGLDEVMIEGHASAPAKLARLSLAGRELEADTEGFFSIGVPYEEGRELEFEAEDRQGRRTRLVLVLRREGEAATAPSAAPRPGTSVPPPSSEAESRNHALLVSVGEYLEFPKLGTVGNDVRELAEILSQRYGFKTQIVTDPDQLSFLKALDTLRKTLEPEDNLLIYYAGHGQIDTEGRGYWIPVNASADDEASWIPNGAITDYLSEIPARHILVISDSCYSGTMTRTGVPRIRGQEGEELAVLRGKPSRTVLTSGGLKPVLDVGGGEHSVFAEQLLRVLRNNFSILTGSELKEKVAARVTRAAAKFGFEQEPDYAPIQYAGHEAGEFVFDAAPATGRPGP